MAGVNFRRGRGGLSSGRTNGLVRGSGRVGEAGGVRKTGRPATGWRKLELTASGGRSARGAETGDGVLLPMASNCMTARPRAS